MPILLLRPRVFSTGDAPEPVDGLTGGHYGLPWHIISRQYKAKPREKKPLRTYDPEKLRQAKDIKALELPRFTEIDSSKWFEQVADLSASLLDLDALIAKQNAMLAAVQAALDEAQRMNATRLVAEGIQRQAEEAIRAEQLAKEREFIERELRLAKQAMDDDSDEMILISLLGKMH